MVKALAPSIQAALEILDAIENDGDNCAMYALRVIPGDFAGVIQNGDALPASKQWDDGCETDEDLIGTSSFKISEIDEDSILEALDLLGALGKNGPNGYYFGDRVALIKGEFVGNGEDCREALIADAVVVGIWKKPTKGLSEIRPNAGFEA